MKIIKMGHLARINTQNMEWKTGFRVLMACVFHSFYFQFLLLPAPYQSVHPINSISFFSWLTKEKKKNTAIILLLFPHILESNI